jgi:SAM-dependent methyltransferase
MIENFELISQYYDLLYNDKNYEEESNYINNLIKKHNDRALKILDVGCGTGKHAECLNNLGYELTGIDLSDKMIEIAKNNAKKNDYDIVYNIANANQFNLNKKFDIVISLFHVISYQTSNKKLINTFKSINKHLEINGLLIFDFWYGPGVLSELPSSRKKVFKSKDLEIYRKSIPKMIYSKNLVDVSFEIDVKSLKQSFSFKENHLMRYLFDPELQLILSLTGFEIIDSFEWMKFKKPDNNSWHSVLVARKINHE